MDREPRVAPVTELDDELRAMLGQTFRRDGQYQNIFLTLGHRRDLMQHVIALGGQFLVRGRLDPHVRELVILRVAQRAGSPYELAQHVLIARSMGMDEATIDAAREASATLPREHRALLEVADQLVDERQVDDVAWAEARHVLGDDDGLMIELLLLVGFYVMVGGFLNAAGVPLDDGLPTPSRA